MKKCDNDEQDTDRNVQVSPRLSTDAPERPIGPTRVATARPGVEQQPGNRNQQKRRSQQQRNKTSQTKLHGKAFRSVGGVVVLQTIPGTRHGLITIIATPSSVKIVKAKLHEVNLASLLS